MNYSTRQILDTTTHHARCYTVSAGDTVFGGRVNCGSYATLAEAIAYAESRTGGHEYAHRIHENPQGYGLVDTPTVWESLDRTPRKRGR